MRPDLPTTAFLALRERFFDAAGEPVPFTLRPKAKTQDDPFDEYLATKVLADLDGIDCVKASGPLITPDMVLCRQPQCESAARAALADDLDLIVGLEVKKLERTKQGKVARASGMDYNTTPPCGRMRVYDDAEDPVDIRGFYLFVCVEAAEEDKLVVTACSLVDGGLLNQDFDYYLSIVGPREKKIGLGTYGDGADRKRPMLIFANPLGIEPLSRGAYLVHRSPSLEEASPRLRRAFAIERSTPDGDSHRFSTYQVTEDLEEEGGEVEVLEDPFPTPRGRSGKTSQRGRFKLPFRL